MDRRRPATGSSRYAVDRASSPSGKFDRKLSRSASSGTRSCGRRGPATRRLDGREVERQELVEGGAVAGLAPQALFLGVALDQVDPLRRTAGEPQVGERLVIDREERGGRPELGAHVADRRAIGQGQAGQAVAGELDERADDPVVAQHLGHDEHEVRGGRALGQLAGESHADDMRHRLVERLAEQDGLGLDAADAVAEHAERVDHRRVRIGADERVREGHAVAVGRRPVRGTRG